MLSHEQPTTGVSRATPEAGPQARVPVGRNQEHDSGRRQPIRSPTPPAWRSRCFRQQGTGTHPTVVTLAPTDDWQAAIAASVLMAPPIRAPILLSGGVAALRRPPMR